jgi:hypothetical protein
MKKLLIKQAILLPVIYFGFIILASLFAEDYSHWGQHASELGINPEKSAVIIFQAGVVLTSLSMMLLALGLIVRYGRRFTISALLIFAFGITFIFGAIFPIGSPWHGAYGIGLFIMILPFVFLYEVNELKTKQLHNFSIAAGFLMFFYFWLMIARLDPVEYRGLTQRLFGVVVFGWFSYIAYQLYRMDRLSR